MDRISGDWKVCVQHKTYNWCPVSQRYECQTCGLQFSETEYECLARIAALEAKLKEIERIAEARGSEKKCNDCDRIAVLAEGFREGTDG